tara:strand:+ start:65 stop:460 length:396 start_codon:yes stop_codon:yes gene_type:complete
MTKTLNQIKADVKEFGEDYNELVAAYSYYPVKAKWDAMVDAVETVETWSTKTYHNAAFQLIMGAEQNASDSADSQIRLFVNGEDSGIVQSPDASELNTAYYQMCIGSLDSEIEEMASEDYEFYEVISAIIK